MSDYVLFQMWNPFRASLIEQHNFYVREARNRLLSRFDKIEADAERAAEAWLEESGRWFNPDGDDPGSYYEAGNDVGIQHYQMLSDMHEQTRLSVVAGNGTNSFAIGWCARFNIGTAGTMCAKQCGGSILS